jgi:hypothetical protein
MKGDVVVALGMASVDAGWELSPKIFVVPMR